jgi:hypothetical protein
MNGQRDFIFHKSSKFLAASVATNSLNGTQIHGAGNFSISSLATYYTGRCTVDFYVLQYIRLSHFYSFVLNK